MKVRKGEIIFPRIEQDRPQRQMTRRKRRERPRWMEKFISIDDFAKVDLRVATVLECEKVEKSKKLSKAQARGGGRGKAGGIRDFRAFTVPRTW
jgi:methionyl-tRNA synthetase